MSKGYVMGAALHNVVVAKFRVDSAQQAYDDMRERIVSRKTQSGWYTEDRSLPRLADLTERKQAFVVALQTFREVCEHHKYPEDAVEVASALHEGWWSNNNSLLPVMSILSVGPGVSRKARGELVYSEGGNAGQDALERAVWAAWDALEVARVNHELG